MLDDDLAQLVGTMFIKDPSYRKSWTDHVNQPTIRDASGAVVSGPPQTFSESKALAEKILRSSSVMAGIDELSSSSGVSKSAAGAWGCQSRGTGRARGVRCDQVIR